jgi:beta-galactosidase
LRTRLLSAGRRGRQQLETVGVGEHKLENIKMMRYVRLSESGRGKLLVSVLAAVISVSAVVLMAQPRALPADRGASSGQNSFYPAAVWYGGGKARAPMLERIDSTSAERWGKDLDKIKAVGFNTVKTWVDWATAEPKQGQFSFDSLDLVMRLAQERGLKVIIQIYSDSAPDWIGQHYQDGRFVDRSGVVINSQAAPGYCIDHDGVRRETVKFFEALSQEANRFPALYGWDVWSEPHVINWAAFPYLTNPEFCFCASSQARFRAWLKEKYKTIGGLNAAWYRSFESWEQVEPPRYPTILTYTDYIDWRTFIDDKLAGDLKTRVDAVRSADKSHPITAHAAHPALFTSPMYGYGSPDDWKMSASADFYGTSTYPKHANIPEPLSPLRLSAFFDFARSAAHSFGKPFWIGELQAGQGSRGMAIADPVDSHDEEYWIWKVVSHGASEFAVYAWYPMNSGYESNGYGLINLDGTLTDRARAAGNTASIAARHASELLEAKPATAEVAILFNRLSFMVGGSERTLSKLGNAEPDSVVGLYDAFYQQNIPVDFIHPLDITGDRLNQYKVVFLPYPVMLAQDVAEGVKRYVQNGGTVVAEARLAWNDQRGFANDEIPGFGLAEVFGAKERLIRPSEQPQIILDKSVDLPGLGPRRIAVGAAVEEDLEALPGAQVLARFKDGQAAIVKNSYGKGKTFLVGSFLGLAYRTQHNDETKQLLLSLAKAAGVSPEVEVSGAAASQVEVRRLVKEDQQVIFAFNESSNPADITLRVHLPWIAQHVKDWGNDKQVPFQVRGETAVLQKNLTPHEIWVVSVEAH